MPGFKWLLDSVYMYFVTKPLAVISAVFAVLMIASVVLVLRALTEEEYNNDK